MNHQVNVVAPSTDGYGFSITDSRGKLLVHFEFEHRCPTRFQKMPKSRGAGNPGPAPVASCTGGHTGRQSQVGQAAAGQNGLATGWVTGGSPDKSTRCVTFAKLWKLLEATPGIEPG
jgi:hypothetical protein